MTAKKLTLREQITLAHNARGMHDTHKPEYRLGQSFFNELFLLAPELANEITDMPGIDPFYQDSNLPDFYEYISEPTKSIWD